MPTRRIYLSPSSRERHAAAREFLSELPANAPVLVLSAEQQSSDHFARELAAEKGSLFGYVRLTLDALAYQLALHSLAREGLATHSRLGREAVTARILYEARLEQRLGPLAPVAEGPGLVRALARTLHECRLHAIARERFRGKGGVTETLGELLERYEVMSARHSVADRPDVLARAISVVETLEGPPAALATLLLDVALETPLETELVAALANKAPAILATVPEGDDVTLARLEGALGCRGESSRAVSDVESTALGDLKTFVFSRKAPPPRESNDDVVILSAPGEAQEAVEIARALQREAQRGVPFDAMAVLLRAPETYTSLLEDAFVRSGIPAYFEDGTIRPDPAGRAFLALLDCASEQFSATRFAEYLSLGQIPETDPRGAPKPAEPESEPAEPLWVPPQHSLAPAARDAGPTQLELFAPAEKLEAPETAAAIEGSLRAPWRWEKLLVDAAVIGGEARWERRLVGLERELELRRLELDDPDGPKAEALAREIQELSHLKHFALPLVRRLSALPQSESWGRWLDALETLATMALARPEGVLALLKELRPMASVGPVDLLEVREVLSERLTQLSQAPSDYRYGKVWVAPIEAVRGAHFDLVVVPGLAERMFPQKIMEDPLLLDSERKELADTLSRQRNRIARERLRLRLAVGAANERIIFSYPSVDLAKGRAKVPSFYLLEVARASQGRLPDFESLEREAASSSGARLGWPAPRDRGQAIDATEYDLAFLADALRRDASEEQVRGTGRYLMDVNEALSRSLRARYQRGRAGRFTPADGFLDPSTDSLEALHPHRLEARPYSVTALEKYAACPYRFYLNAVLRLRPRDTIESMTHLDALTRGSILHDAQFHILQRLESAELFPITEANLDGVLQVFEVVFDEVAARFREELAPAIERIWNDELERIRFDLRGWLRREAAADDGFVPFRREYTFGMAPRGPADPTSTLDVAVLANGLRLRGAIDLVEKRADGKVRVTDHKSGKVWMPKGTVLNGGESLQPILYTLAYEALTGEQVESARLYYCTQRGGYEQRVVHANQESLEVVAEFQRRLDEIIRDGFFPASPKPPLGCRFCDYATVCGPRAEIDAKRKHNDPRLSPLNWLRNLT